jgi:thymidylate synthase
MYLAVPSQPSCAQAWLAATRCVSAQPNYEALNVVIDIAQPDIESTVDIGICTEVDQFLQANQKPPTRSVANTIFPQDVYERHGAPAFYEVYLTKIFPRKASGDWGRYFERMINLPNGAQNRPTNPLDGLVQKMRSHLHENERTFKNIYELAIYDPARDAGRVMNRQCLSFLSFKLTDERRLMLTALYRNHYYMQRLLGNLLGLANLMKFIAQETKIDVGSLTIVSTHAEVDTIGNRKGTAALIERCTSKLATAV